ncbi:hypothetical protein HZH66_006691 [Vespula vulgaris]|uniref:Uncharacterized protein n=1 Tax=Vespula vulgaris TaxID=7454 RepID=A0A834N8H1_VESVU|nr:hypothetical protein HZH66_006691 [Vespula vulgaris]
MRNQARRGTYKYTSHVTYDGAIKPFADAFQNGVTVLSRQDFTTARNALPLGREREIERNAIVASAGPNLCQVDRVSPARLRIKSNVRELSIPRNGPTFSSLCAVYTDTSRVCAMDSALSSRKSLARMEYSRVASDLALTSIFSQKSSIIAKFLNRKLQYFWSGTTMRVRGKQESRFTGYDKIRLFEFDYGSPFATDLDELKVKLIAEGDEGKEVEAELRADYTIEELNELVHYVKGMTTLSGLAKKDWTYQCHVIIREFFENPKHRVLCIYYEVTNKVPMALLSFPLTPVYELCYFIRKPDQIFRLENFHDTIVFGSFNWSVEYYILNVVQSVLTPIIFKIETLPDIANSVGEQAQADGSSCGSFSRLASHDAKGDHVDTRTALASA